MIFLTACSYVACFTDDSQKWLESNECDGLKSVTVLESNIMNYYFVSRPFFIAEELVLKAEKWFVPPYTLELLTNDVSMPAASGLGVP